VQRTRPVDPDGTDPNDACADTSTTNDEADDKWPPDFNDDQFVLIGDVLAMKPVFLSFAPGPPYDPRFDLVDPDPVNGAILLGDVLKMKDFFLQSCA
jgi:hypothetical protein